MRLSNKRKLPIYNFLNTLLIMGLLIGVLAFLLEKVRFKVLGSEAVLLVLLPILLLFLFYVNGRQIFEYDSDGEAVHFRNRSIMPIVAKPLSDEFPKYKFLKYETINFFFFKRLYITVRGKNGNIILKYEISYLSNKEFKDLKFSLNKLMKNNKENVHNE